MNFEHNFEKKNVLNVFFLTAGYSRDRILFWLLHFFYHTVLLKETIFTLNSIENWDAKHHYVEL